MRKHIFTKNEKEIIEAYVKSGEKKRGFRVLKHRLPRFWKGVLEDIGLWKSLLMILRARGEIPKNLEIEESGFDKEVVVKFIEAREALKNLKNRLTFIETLLTFEGEFVFWLTREIKKYQLLPKEAREQWYPETLKEEKGEI